MVSETCNRKIRGWCGEVSEITPYLLLSGARVVRPDRLKEMNVSCVISVTSELPELRIDGIEVITIRVSDSQTASLSSSLHSLADKLMEVKARGEIALVHCIAGVSRSPTVVIAYLIKHEGLTLKDAYFRVKRVRPIIRPNSNFFQQLIEFEEEVQGTKSVELIPVPNSRMFIPDVCEEEIKLMGSRSWTDMIRARKNFKNQFA